MSESKIRNLAGARRILIIDDDTSLLSGLEHALRNQGYTVMTCSDGEQGLASHTVFQPDLVVLDVMMPAVDGWQVLERLRSQDSGSSVPVIMLTADDSSTSKIRGFELGADDYLTKPFSVRELRCRIAAVLRRASSEPFEQSDTVPVVQGSGIGLLRARDIFYVEGIRNYSYVHTADSRFLSRLTLGALEQKGIAEFRRVHRSYIVNMNHVRGCGWAGKSSYRLRLADAADTEIPVSRAMIPEIQRELGLKP